MKRRTLSVATLLILLAGCAPLPPVPTDYACDGGRGFRLFASGEARAIEINGMRFDLENSRGDAGETIYSCSMLKLTMQEGRASVAMEGRPYLAGCRPLR